MDFTKNTGFLYKYFKVAELDNNWHGLVLLTEIISTSFDQNTTIHFYYGVAILIFFQFKGSGNYW